MDTCCYTPRSGIHVMQSTVSARIHALEQQLGCTPDPSQYRYPGESGLYDDAISVLMPVGAALVGLTEGKSINYAPRDGKPATISAMPMLYQPEASRRVRLS